MASSDQIRAYLARRYGTSVSVDGSLLDSGLLDSLGIFELVSFLQETFGIEVEDDAIVPDNFETVAQISAFVDGKLARKT